MSSVFEEQSYSNGIPDRLIFEPIKERWTKSELRNVEAMYLPCNDSR